MKTCKHEFKKLTFKSSLGEDFVECECGRKFYPGEDGHDDRMIGVIENSKMGEKWAPAN